MIIDFEENEFTVMFAGSKYFPAGQPPPDGILPHYVGHGLLNCVAVVDNIARWVTTSPNQHSAYFADGDTITTSQIVNANTGEVLLPAQYLLFESEIAFTSSPLDTALSTILKYSDNTTIALGLGDVPIYVMFITIIGIMGILSVIKRLLS